MANVVIFYEKQIELKIDKLSIFTLNFYKKNKPKINIY